MTLDKAIDFLNTFINFEKNPGKYGPLTYIPERVGLMLDKAGLDAGGIKIIHIAGTKGKGSTAHYASRLLELSKGGKTGLYTSPHVLKINERIRINSEMISDEDLIRLIEKYHNFIQKYNWEDRLTYFDVMTFLAMACFIENACDYIVLETGLGGRLDSTNFCKPVVSVITSIGFDHTALLGGTLAEIAGEKAGIIKEKTPVISAFQGKEALARLKQEAEKKESLFYYLPLLAKYKIHKRSGLGSVFDIRIKLRNKSLVLKNIHLSQTGDVYVENFLTALTAVLTAGVRLSEENIRTCARMRIPFRTEKRGNFILDAAHNDSSMESLFKTIREYYKPVRVNLYIGILSDKELPRIAEKIKKYAGLFQNIILYDFPSARGSGGKTLYEMVKSLPQSDYKKDLSKIKIEKDSLNVFTGSFQNMDKILNSISMEEEEYVSFLNRGLDVPEWEELYLEAVKDKIPVIRKETARLLYFLIKAKAPRNVLEIGSGSGYSTLWLMKGLPEGSKITALERDSKRFTRLKKVFRGCKKIRLLRRDAFDFLGKTSEMFDFVFLDAQKRDYPAYLSILRNKIIKDGVLAADNFLFAGMAASLPEDKKGKYMGGVRLLREFNEELSRDNCFEALFLSLEDGVVIAERR